MNQARTRGQAAEAHARAYLERQGLRHVEGNYRCPGGEIDLVMRDGDTLVFVEVRYRRSERYGGAAASVDGRKQARLLHAARHYLHRHRLDLPVRFDVIALAPGDGGYQTQWIRNAIES